MDVNNGQLVVSVFWNGPSDQPKYVYCILPEGLSFTQKQEIFQNAPLMRHEFEMNGAEFEEMLGYFSSIPEIEQINLGRYNSYLISVGDNVEGPNNRYYQYTRENHETARFPWQYLTD